MRPLKNSRSLLGLSVIFVNFEFLAVRSDERVFTCQSPPRILPNSKGLKLVAQLVYPPPSTAEAGQSHRSHQYSPIALIHLNSPENHSHAQGHHKEATPAFIESRSRIVSPTGNPTPGIPGIGVSFEVATAKEVGVTAVVII